MNASGSTATHGDGVPTAQSIVALFEQLQRQGFTGAELIQMRRAYGLAMSLFSGRFHPSGKPYVAHCTGTASALAALGADADLIAAALVHTAYHWGDFGPWRMFLPFKRRRLRRHLGPMVEEYAYRFQTSPWKSEAVERLAAQSSQLSRIERNVALLQLANDLDNTRSLACGYAINAGERNVALMRKGPAMVDLAGKLGFPSLAKAIHAAVDSSLHGAQLAHIHWEWRGVALIPPASARKRLSRRINEQLHRARQQLRRA